MLDKYVVALPSGMVVVVSDVEQYFHVNALRILYRGVTSARLWYAVVVI